MFINYNKILVTKRSTISTNRKVANMSQYTNEQQQIDYTNTYYFS